MVEEAGHHLGHGTFEMSVGHPKTAILQDSKREVCARDTNLGIVTALSV